MFQSFARRFRRDPDEPAAELKPLGIDKTRSHELWEEAKSQATEDGEIAVRRALEIFDQLVSAEKERLQSDRRAKLIPIRKPDSDNTDQAPPSLITDTAVPTKAAEPAMDLGPIGYHPAQSAVEVASLCKGCGRPAIEGRDLCSACTAPAVTDGGFSPSTVPEAVLGAATTQSQAAPLPETQSSAAFRLFSLDSTVPAGQPGPPQPDPIERDFPFHSLRQLSYHELPKRRSRRLVPAMIVALVVVALLLSWKYIWPAAQSLFTDQNIDQADDGTGSVPNDSASAAQPGQHSRNSQTAGKTASLSNNPGSAFTTSPGAPGELVITVQPLSPLASLPTTPPAIPIHPVELLPTQAASLLIRQIAPQYPPQAQAAGVKGGHVTLRVVVDETGRVVSAEPIAGDVSLVDSAENAVKLWQYRPYVVASRVKAFKTTVVVDFSLASSGK